jgi:hypothetical protein
VAWPRVSTLLRRYAVYGLLIGAALLARVALVADKQSIEHDEAISYLAAAGHLGDYERVITTGEFPYDQWATARAWQGFVTPDKPLTFGSIATDLAHHHPHPPLYFWLLHLWTRHVGVAAWSGPLLNVLIDAVTGLALYRLARCSFAPDRALTAVVLWALGTFSLLTMIVARPYSLFTLMAVLYALAVRRFTSPRTNNGTPITAANAVLLVLTGAAGLLTHFYFFLALLAGGTVVLAQRDRARALAFGSATLLSGALFAALHPHFLIAVKSMITGQFAWAAFPDRLKVVAGALAMLSIPVMAAFVLPLISMIARRGRSRERVSGSQNEIFLAWMLGGQLVLYLMQIGPEHALMDYRYLSPAWPFVALVIVRALNAPDLARLACVGMLALAGIVAWPERTSYVKPEPDTRLLIDNPARGVLLPVVMVLDGSTPIFAADQADLRAEPDRWLPDLARDGGLYSYLPLYTATDSGHTAILDLIAAEADVTPARERFIWQADFHREHEQVLRVSER